MSSTIATHVNTDVENTVLGKRSLFSSLNT